MCKKKKITKIILYLSVRESVDSYLDVTNIACVIMRAEPHTVLLSYLNRLSNR